jgi:glucoamylase
MAALGGPGIRPTWTSGAKAGVGSSVGTKSLVWFTLSQGILNEVYYPRIDSANIKEAQFLVTADSLFSDEKTRTSHEIERLDPWSPAFRITNTCLNKHYRIIKKILTDPERNVLLQHIQFEPLKGSMQNYSLYALITPQMANMGFENNAWTGEYNGNPILYACRDNVYLAVMSSLPFIKSSVGYVGCSDGWTDISLHQTMTWEYSSAQNGHVLLTGQITLPSDGIFTLAFAFGKTPEEAAHEAQTTIEKGFDTCLAEYTKEWNEHTKNFRDLSAYSGDQGELFRSSIQVFLSHEDKIMRGATVASLAFPWGHAQLANGSVGGYHLVWPRDLVETATARLAVDDQEGAQRILVYLAHIQENNGGWHQNNWIDGTPFWNGVQIDETAFPIILAWRLYDIDALGGFDPWPMVHKATSFLVQTGPVTQQERWEEDGGYSPSTLATAITALVCAADMAQKKGEETLAFYIAYVADWWASNLDAWTYTTNSMLDPDLPAHYERLNTIVMTKPDISNPNEGTIPIRNLSPDEPSDFPARDVIDAGFLQLVYFGVRLAHDPYILNSLQVVDKVLKVEMTEGPSWHRYNHDGYGEHVNGDPFQGWGVGQAWPLLTGERGHYELAAGHEKEVDKLIRTMEGFAGNTKLLPEQVWAKPDIPEKGLYLGKPSGSAMPLVWAHAEYIKLLRSRADGHTFDLVRVVAERYKEGPPHLRNVWRYNHKISSTKVGEPLRIEVLANAMVHWSIDNWKTANDCEMTDSGLGTRYYDILPIVISKPATFIFTLYWHDSQKWEGTDFIIQIRTESSLE